MKPIDGVKYEQRFTPRKPKAQWFAMNIERLRQLMRQKKVTRAGLEAAGGVLGMLRREGSGNKVAIPPDILKALKKNPTTWKNFSRFLASYKRIRVGWIDGSRHRPEIFRVRLNYFLKMTKQTKRFGMVQ